jgi:hypothetical protein
VDGGATFAFRIDGKLSIHQPQAFLHAREAKTAAPADGSWVKTDAEIANSEVNLPQDAPKTYFEALHSAMFCGVAQGFL